MTTLCVTVSYVYLLLSLLSQRCRQNWSHPTFNLPEPRHTRLDMSSLVRGLRAAITAIFPTDLVSSYITNCWPCFWHVILCHTCMHARTNSWIIYSRRRWLLPMLRPAGVALQDPSSVVTENVDVKRISKPRLIALPSRKSKNTRLTSRSDLSAHTRQIGLKSRSPSPRSAIAYR